MHVTMVIFLLQLIVVNTKKIFYSLEPFTLLYVKVSLDVIYIREYYFMSYHISYIMRYMRNRAFLEIFSV